MTKQSKPEQISEVGSRLRNLRQRSHMSMRHLAEQASVAASYIAGVENGRISPTIATFRKLLVVLGTDLGDFFSDEISESKGYVFRREDMRTVVDAGRCYTFILPRRPDLKAEMVDEEFTPGENPEMEVLSSDLAGYVLKGNLTIEIEGEEPQMLRAGDAYYITAGRSARGYAADDKPARVLTVQIPPTY